MQLDLRETHIIGRQTREQMLSSAQIPAMAGAGIELAGISEARRGFLFARHSPSFAVVIGSLQGAGMVWVDGRWRRCGAGKAYLVPAGSPHAYKAAGRWKICWVHLQRNTPISQILERQHADPSLVDADVSPLASAIEGLNQGFVAGADRALLHLWLELVDALLQRLCRPGGTDPRLVRLWEIVAADLSHPWTGQELSARMGLSAEHLRKLCLRYYGISPIERLTRMRMDRAVALLGRSVLTITAVADAVGYLNPFAFSTAFKRKMGVPPSSYPRK